MEAPLQIGALGALTVTVFGRRVDSLLSQKAGALLVYLAMTAQVQAREHLATLLWNDRTPERAFGSLRMAALELRRQIAPLLDTSRQTMALIPAGYQLDARELMEAAESARQESAPTRLEVDPMLRLAAALERYHGDFLRDFYGGGTEFEQWLLVERERLRACFFEGTRCLAATYLREQRHAEGLALVRRALSIDPLHESLNRQMMALLADGGERRAALDHYHIFAQRLTDELELTPEAETVTLYRRLCAAQPDENEYAINGKSLDISPFIGRQAALDEIVARFAEPDCHLLTLVGPGGIGKTRLALAAVDFYRRSTAFQDGIHFVPLAPYTTPQQIIPAVAQTVGFKELRDKRTLELQLIDFFRRKRALLVFDNYEHLLSGAEIAAKFSALPDVRVLVTSREPLEMVHEQVLTLSGLAYPTVSNPPTDYAAAQLFVRAVRRVYPDYSFDRQDQAAIGQICRLVDGSPLGLLLAAVWIDVLTPAEIANELRNGIDFLENNVPGLPERQCSIRAVFASTWQRLPERLREVFMRLAVVRGGCSRSAAQAIAGASLRELQFLISKSLLSRDTSGRLNIHELLRQYAEEQLKLANLYSAARDVHSDYYLHFLNERELDIQGRNQLEALASIDMEFENVRDAWLWAVEKGYTDRLGESLEGFYWYCDLRERRADRLALLQAALDATPSTDERWRGRLLARCWESAPQGRTRLRQALAVAIRNDDRAEIAECLYQRGLIAELDHRSNAASRHLQRAFACYRSLDDDFYEGVVCLARAMSLLHDAHVDETEQLTRESLPLMRRSGDVLHLALLLRCRGSSLGVVGENEAADRCHEEARELLHRQQNDLMAADIAAWDMGISVLRAGDFPLARQRAKHLLELAEAYGYQVGQGRAFCVLSGVTLVEGDYERSYEYARQAEQLLAHHVNLLYAQTYASTAAAALGDFRSARLRVKRVLPQAVKFDEQVLICLLLPVTAVILTHDGQHKRAREVITLALHHRASMCKWAESVLSHFQLAPKFKRSVALLDTSENNILLDPRDIVEYFTPLKNIVPFSDG